MSTALVVRLLAIVTVVAHSPLVAQSVSIWSLEKGDRIRVVERGLSAGSSGSTTIGLFDAHHADTIRVNLETGGHRTFALDDITRLGVSRGRERATKAGVGAGLAVGIVIGLATGEPRRSNQANCGVNTEPPCGLKVGPITVGQETVTAAVAGLAIGGILGSLIKYEVWNGVTFDVNPQRFTLTLTMESRAGNRVRKNSLPSRNIRR